MQHKPEMNDEMEDLQRRLAFAEACSDPLDFDRLLAQASGLLHKWAQADVVTLILPPEREGVEPMLHLFGRQPVLPYAERSVRDECASLLAEMEFADLPGEALRLRRGPELMPLHEPVRDDALYRFWSSALVHEGQVVGIVALFGFTDWLLSVRLRRLLQALVPSLAGAVARAAAVENLRLCAQKDEVTGGYNRRGFVEVLGRACARAEATGESLALLMVDVEGAGGEVGEGALRALGEVVRASGRAFDVFGRFGARELVLLLPGADGEAASAVGERLVDDARRVVAGGGVRVDVGVAVYGGGGPELLVQAADEALYAAKRQSARLAGAV